MELGLGVILAIGGIHVNGAMALRIRRTIAFLRDRCPTNVRAHVGGVLLRALLGERT